MYQYSALPAVLRFGIAVIVFIFVSCTGPSAHKRQQDKLLAQLDSQQVVVTEFIQGQTSQVLAGIQDRLTDPFSAEKAKLWEPKTAQTHSLTKAVIQYMKNTGEQLKKTSVAELFIKRGEGRNLYSQLALYKKNILNIDHDITAEFSNKFLTKFDTTENNIAKNADEYTRKYIANLDVTEAGTLLHKLEQELALAENRIITFCYYRTDVIRCWFDVTSALVGQNTTSLSKGEVLTINAGVGSFSSRANPKITINGIPVKTENAVAVYKTKIYQQPGKYSLPVVIKYLEANGMEMVQQVTVDYTVK